jgi:cytochrome c
MSGNLGGNMIMGAVLASALGVLGLQTVASNVYHPQFAEKPGYTVDIPDAPAPGAEVEAPKPIDWGVVLADAANLPALVAKGESLHKACVACHSFDAGGANGTGPALYGVVGRLSGAHPGFAYSEAMAAHAKPWSYDELFGFLGAPASYINGTKMSFAGYKKPEDRVALVAFLRTLAPSPAPLPAPLPPEAAPAAEEAPAEAPAEAAPATP